MRQLKGSERTDWSTEPEASFSPEQFQANECTFFLWPRYSLVSRPPGQSLVVRSMVSRAARREAERRRREDQGEKSGQSECNVTTLLLTTLCNMTVWGRGSACMGPTGRQAWAGAEAWLQENQPENRPARPGVTTSCVAAASAAADAHVAYSSR